MKLANLNFYSETAVSMVNFSPCNLDLIVARILDIFVKSDGLLNDCHLDQERKHCKTEENWPHKSVPP